MRGWDKRTLQALLIPGGLLLLASTILLQSRFASIPAAAVQPLYLAGFVAGALLALRFQSSRVAMVLVCLLLADRAISFFSGGHGTLSGPGRAALEIVALLLPLNFALTAWTRERGLVFPQVAAGLALLFAESVVLTLVARSETRAGPTFLHFALLNRQLFLWTKIPQLALLGFTVAFIVLAIRFLLCRTPVESGLLWAMAAAFLALQAGAVGRTSSAYLATGAMILAASLVESSYRMAFHDELTSLPARRAFDQALPRLSHPYTVAVVDIDYFKTFNDTYGHDTGDQVLRMVAGRLARVSGGGEAFRVGGEEFAILFPGQSLQEAGIHLEELRTEIAGSRFRLRGGQDRRIAGRGPDRRRGTGGNRRISRARVRPQDWGGHVSVTVSIGVAESGARTRDAELVVRAADKALYRAKQAGRNRVESAVTPRARAAKRSIA